jgi:hypothetical protein
MLHIVTLAEMRAELGYEENDIADDTQLQRAMEGMQARFESHLARPLLRAENAEEILNGGTQYIYLKRYPLEAKPRVWVATDQDWSDDNELEADDFLANLIRGELCYGLGSTAWPAGYQSIRVLATGGYVACGENVGTSQTAMPEDVRRAFRMQLAFEWRNRKHLGEQYMSANKANLTLAPVKFLPEVLDTLAPLIRMLPG